MRKNLGMLLLGLWLVIQGLTHFVDFRVSGLSTVMAVLALVAGILIIRERWSRSA